MHPRIYDLAYHWDAAGESSKAWRYAMLAAEQARNQSALEVAAKQFEVARHNAADVDSIARYRMSVGQGETLLLLGLYEAAMAATEGAVELVEDPARKARIELLQADIAANNGALDQSSDFAERGLQRLGFRFPKSLFGTLCGILWQVGIQVLHHLSPPKRNFDGNMQLVARLLNRMAVTYIFRESFRCIFCNLNSLNRFDRLPITRDSLHCYGHTAGLSSMFGLTSRGNLRGRTQHSHRIRSWRQEDLFLGRPLAVDRIAVCPVH